MDDIWFWLILVFVIVLFAIVENLLLGGVLRSAISAFVLSAGKLKFLRPKTKMR